MRAAGHVAGLLSALLYVHLAGLAAVNGAAAVGEFLATMAALFGLYAWVGRREWSWPMVMGWAVAYRLILLPAGLPAGTEWAEKARLLAQDVRGEAVVYERFLLYDNDIWRYLWDGHVAAGGGNPYLTSPAEGEGEGIWEEIRERVSYAQIPTLYPPLAEGVFRWSHAVGAGSVLVLKGLTTLFDLGAGVLLALTLRALGRHPGESVLYLWNPLVVKVFAGSGHIDSMTVCALAALGYFLVRRWHWAAGVAFGLAVLAKLSPLILIGLLARELRARHLGLSVAVVLAGYLPYASGGVAIFAGLRTFASFWEFNAGALNLVRWGVGDSGARAICAGLLLAAVGWIWGRKGEFFGSAADSLGALVVLSPAVMPWYVTWTLPYAVVGGRWPWLIYSGLVLAAFGVMVDGRERAWVLAMEYGLLAAAWAGARHSGRPAAPGVQN